MYIKCKFFLKFSQSYFIPIAYNLMAKGGGGYFEKWVMVAKMAVLAAKNNRCFDSFTRQPFCSLIYVFW